MTHGKLQNLAPELIPQGCEPFWVGPIPLVYGLVVIGRNKQVGGAWIHDSSQKLVLGHIRILELVYAYVWVYRVDHLVNCGYGAQQS